MSLKPMTKANEPKTHPVKLKASVKTTAVENMNLNFVTWKDLENGQKIVFELTDGEFITRVSEKNKNWKFENFYTWKVVVTDKDDNVVRVVEASDKDNLIQVPCQQSHRQGIKELLELGETVAMYSNLKVNVAEGGTTYYNCNVESLDLESLEDFKA